MTQNLSVAFAEANDGSEADTIDKFVLAASYSRAGFDVGGTYVRRAVTSRMLRGSFGADNALGGEGANADTVTRTDTEINPTTYGVAFGYGQDNWSLDYWYGRTDHDNSDNTENTLHSLSGQLGVGKATLRALWERDSGDRVMTGARDDGTRILNNFDLAYWTLGAQYDLGSRARVFAEYESEEEDSVSSANVKTTKDTDIFVVGYRVDF